MFAIDHLVATKPISSYKLLRTSSPAVDDAERVANKLLMHDDANLVPQTIDSFIDSLKKASLAAVPLSVPCLLIPELDVEVLLLFAVWDHVCLVERVSDVSPRVE
jgi:hypothetical protein